MRYGCTWPGTAQDETADRTRFTVEISDGVYRCRVLVVVVGVAEPFTPAGAGMAFTHHYADVRPVESYAGKRVLIMGKQNSGFEPANGLLPWAQQIVLMSLSHAKLSVDTKTLVGVRARYVQPFEDQSWVEASASWTRRWTASSGTRTAVWRSPSSGPTVAGTSRWRWTTSSRRPGSSRRCATCGSRSRDVRAVQGAGPDTLVGEHRARDPLRGHDRAGGQGPAAPRRPVQLRGGPWRSLQRPRPCHRHRRTPVRDRGSSSTDRSGTGRR